MPRFLYSLLITLALPFIFLRLIFKARRQRAYLADWRERFACCRKPPTAPVLWLHAVSLGETRAAFPLIDALLARHPGHTLLLTHMTPTGRAAAAEKYGANVRVRQTWLPYDTPWLMRRFFRTFEPETGILMETEIWPNLVAEAARARVPLLLANARLSARSAKGYAKVAALLRPALSTLRIAAQSRADARRFRALGAPPGQVFVCGNLKFDLTIPPELLERGGRWRAALNGRPVWLAASTREGEERLLLAVHQRLLARFPDLLFVLVPRHPERFGDIARQIAAAGLSCHRKSRQAADRAQVWLGDSLGELPAYYAMAQVAFIGGSLLPLGGQNLIEAAACGTPTLIGPSVFNFSEAVRQAKKFGAARQIADADALFTTLSALLADPTALQTMQQACAPFVASQRGALEKILVLADGDVRA
ncbi:MAG: lipid IV(A) 3-deoxy-D-manno-octulosonic acid transferase [Zoogloeaceae bacterium]|jgi:3-deoxy-D-manno-octulosonic-acid transferase|nr:lipid IV(A) 3-deoxy-D-manno-octulosonic acid transferase [Zoogloeaceae bacterium]